MMAAFTYDQNSLDWTKLNNVNSIPNPANDEFTPEIRKVDFLFGATEGNEGNISVPVFKPGEIDIFYLDFRVDISNYDLSDFVVLTGIRLQALPNDINEGGYFLSVVLLVYPTTHPFSSRTRHNDPFQVWVARTCQNRKSKKISG